MLDIIKWIIGLSFLFLLSYIDIKTYNKKNGYIPSFITTLFLIMAYLINFPSCLFSGILAGLIGLLLTDLSTWGGIADFKSYVASAMLFSTILNVLYFSGFLVIFSLLSKIFFYYFIKKDKNAQMPFIPVIFVSYFITYLLILI